MLWHSIYWEESPRQWKYIGLATGDFEIILVHPSREDEATAIENSLEDYPILSESHFSELEWEVASNHWEHMRIKERIYWCNRYGVSIFAARRDEIPQDSTGELRSALAE
mgnify:CR=1 FL=1